MTLWNATNKYMRENGLIGAGGIIWKCAATAVWCMGLTIVFVGGSYSGVLPLTVAGLMLLAGDKVSNF
jgi:hypothetical protein